MSPHFRRLSADGARSPPHTLWPMPPARRRCEHFRADGLSADNKVTAAFRPGDRRRPRRRRRAMREILAERRPDDAILGEEFGGKAGHAPA